jgi:hypothetical protein
VSALLNDGRVFVWGSNVHGVLGLNDTADKKLPAHLYTIYGLPIKTVAIGQAHMLALVHTESAREKEADEAKKAAQRAPHKVFERAPSAGGGGGEEGGGEGAETADGHPQTDQQKEKSQKHKIKKPPLS